MIALKSVFTMLTQPAATIRRYLVHLPSGNPWFVFGGFVCSWYLFRFLKDIDLFRVRPSSVLILVPVELLLMLIFFFASAAVLHMTADFLGGGGRGITLFRLLLIDILPLWLLGPISYLFHTLTSLRVLSFILMSILLLWTLLLIVLSIKEVYRFTFTRALSTLLTPLAITAIGVFSSYFFLDTFGLNYFKDMIRFLLG